MDNKKSSISLDIPLRKNINETLLLEKINLRPTQNFSAILNTPIDNVIY